MQREIGIIIRVKDAAKAKEEIKGIIDNKLLGNVKSFNDKIKETGDSVSAAGKKAVEAKGGFEKLFGKLTTGLTAVYALKRGLSFAMDSFEQGAGLERAAVQFESSVGKIDKFLPVLRTATRNTVDDMKLLATANRAVMEGLDPRKLTAVYKMATVASRKLGLDTETSISTISNAIVRQDESALTTLGTILKMNIGLKVQNALIAKNGGVMSGAMAVAVRQSVIMDELNRKFGGFNKLQEDSTEILQSFRAAMDNLRMSLGQALGTAIAPILKGVTYLAVGFTNLLNSVKDNVVFKSFIQTLAGLATFLAGKKLLAGLLLAGKAVLALVGGIKMLGIVAASTAGLSFLSMGMEAVKDKTSKAYSVVRGFYDLVTNFDPETGLSSMLKEDKDALGNWFPFVKAASQMYLILKAVVVGTWDGIRQAAEAVLPAIGRLFSSLISAGSELPIIGSVFRGIGAAVEYVGEMFDWAFGKVKAFLDLLSLSHLKRIQTGISDMIGGLGKSVAGVIDLGASKVDNLKESSQGFSSPISAPSGMQFPRMDNEQSFNGVQPRSQNIEPARAADESVMLMMVKTLNKVAESNEQMNLRDQQREITDRVQAFTTVPYSR